MLAQVGPFATVGVGPAEKSVSPLPPEVQQRQAIERGVRERRLAPHVPSAAPAADSKLGACLAAIAVDRASAADGAREWLATAKGAERADAGRCLGAALSALGRFAEAHDALLAARDAAAPGDHALRARLGAMGGNAALAQGDAQAALVALDLARTDAGAASDAALTGGIACDRARALVSLKRDAEADVALADARAVNPADADAWLLSATLARRGNRLADAQRWIEEAARLRPVDPDVGLEAGVIAVLAGHAEAARKSWQSVLSAAPQSDAAVTARGYIAQLDPSDARAPAQR